MASTGLSSAVFVVADVAPFYLCRPGRTTDKRVALFTTLLFVCFSHVLLSVLLALPTSMYETAKCWPLENHFS